MMGLDDIVGAGLKIGSQIIDRVIPDPLAREEAKRKLLELQQTGDLARLDAIVQISLAQAETNTAEAANANIFVSGWRPFIGWICGLSLLYHFITERIILTVLSSYEIDVTLPSFDTGQLMLLITGMLGLGAMRSYEKVQGVVTNEPSGLTPASNLKLIPGPITNNAG